MSDSSGPQAGGVILAGTILVGAIVGVIAGEPTIGVLAGSAIGIVVALAIWLRDRGRRA